MVGGGGRDGGREVEGEREKDGGGREREVHEGLHYTTMGREGGRLKERESDGEREKRRREGGRERFHV